jgi:uncharacterized protein
MFMSTELKTKAIFSKSPIRVLLTGATGFIGQSLVPLLIAQGHNVILLTRSPLKALKSFGNSILAVNDLNLIEKNLPIDLVINLAGARILGMPWTESRKKTLIDSRVKLTESLVQWMHSREQKPSLLMSASAIGYYGIQSQDDLTEITEDHPPQSIFMSQLCHDWEAAATEAIKDNISVNILRFGVVLGKSGALPMMLLPIRMGLGGKLGSGKQILSWIHINDVLLAMAYLANQHFENSLQAQINVFNFTAPEAVTQIQFSQTAAKILHRPWCIPTPALPMKILMGEQSDLLLEGQRVKPDALIKSGFQFAYPTIDTALMDILQK